MQRFRVILAVMLAGARFGGAAEPSLSEVRELLRAKLEGVTETEMAQGDLPALLQQFAGRVALVTNGADVVSGEDPNAPRVAKAGLFDGRFAYVRVGRLADGAAADIERKVGEFSSSNQLAGLVLDLRFASGRDFRAAAAVADLFLAAEAPLLQWKGRTFNSKTKSAPLAAPVAVLINGGTRGAGEGLAAVLREQRAAVIIGSATAGETAEMANHPLSTGQTLRIASATLKLGDGQPLPEGRARPDIVVPVPESDERAYLEDPYRLPGAPGEQAAAGATNRGSRPKMNEAELVRQKREGFREGFDSDTPREGRPLRGETPPGKLVCDPALARGLDLLTGLNLMKPGKPGRLP